MKINLIHLHILLLISYQTAAQDFAPVGAKWHFGESYAWSNNVGFITYECLGDTVINNLPCRVIFKSNGTCCIPGGFHFLLQSNDSVFVYNPITEAFDLIIDFGADVGDSWILNTNPEGNLMSDSTTCMVDSISYFHYSDVDSLKILHVTLTSMAYYVYNGDTTYLSGSSEIIEKIGFRNALLLSDCIYYCDVNFDGDIRCYEDYTTGLITFSNLDCEYTPVENISSTDGINIFPNPSNNRIYIQSPDLNLDYVELFSSDGTQFILQVNNYELDVNSLNPGIYYARIQTTKGVITKTIVVHSSP